MDLSGMDPKIKAQLNYLEERLINTEFTLTGKIDDIHATTEYKNNELKNNMDQQDTIHTESIKSIDNLLKNEIDARNKAITDLNTSISSKTESNSLAISTLKNDTEILINQKVSKLDAEIVSTNI